MELLSGIVRLAAATRRDGLCAEWSTSTYPPHSSFRRQFASGDSPGRSRDATHVVRRSHALFAWRVRAATRRQQGLLLVREPRDERIEIDPVGLPEAPAPPPAGTFRSHGLSEPSGDLVTRALRHFVVYSST